MVGVEVGMGSFELAHDETFAEFGGKIHSAKIV
jgi:hypothetical protein